jgi:hypothetical protein
MMKKIGSRIKGFKCEPTKVIFGLFAGNPYRNGKLSTVDFLAVKEIRIF